MKYKTSLNGTLFIPWQPSTWPTAPVTFDGSFQETLKDIFHETILQEIGNVISDAHAVQGDLQHRGHVVALAMLCAIDTISSYACPKTQVACPTCHRGDGIGPKYRQFIQTFFPSRYQAFTDDIYKLYRNSMVHSWNLFEVAIFPGTEGPQSTNGVLSFGLLDFFNALSEATANFIAALPNDPVLQTTCLQRYSELKAAAVA